MTREDAITAAGQAFAEALADMQRQGIPVEVAAPAEPVKAPKRNRAKRPEPKREAA